jgi:hypothetical protein
MSLFAPRSAYEAAWQQWNYGGGAKRGIPQPRPEDYPPKENDSNYPGGSLDGDDGTVRTVPTGATAKWNDENFPRDRDDGSWGAGVAPAQIQDNILSVPGNEGPLRLPTQYEVPGRKFVDLRDVRDAASAAPAATLEEPVELAARLNAQQVAAGAVAPMPYQGPSPVSAALGAVGQLPQVRTAALGAVGQLPQVRGNTMRTLLFGPLGRLFKPRRRG